MSYQLHQYHDPHCSCHNHHHCCNYQHNHLHQQGDQKLTIVIMFSLWKVEKEVEMKELITLSSVIESLKEVTITSKIVSTMTSPQYHHHYNHHHWYSRPKRTSLVFTIWESPSATPPPQPSSTLTSSCRPLSAPPSTAPSSSATRLAFSPVNFEDFLFRNIVDGTGT